MAKNENNPLAEALASYHSYDKPEVIKLKSKVLNGVLGRRFTSRFCNTISCRFRFW